MAERVAILVDAENMLAMEHSEGAVRFEQLLVDLHARFRPVRFVVVIGTGLHGGRFRQATQNAQAVTVVTRGNVDVAIAVEGMRLVPSLDHLVLVSGDGDLIPLVQAVQETGRRVTIVAPMRFMSAALSIAANNRLEPDQLTRLVAGLVAPGQGGDKAAAIVRLFEGAKRRVVVMDPWTSEATIRLMAFGAAGVDLLLVGSHLDQKTRTEAADVVAAGGRLSVYKSKELHDRWFAVDDMWFHSGGSLKDLGRRWTRLSEITEADEIADTEAMLEHFTVAQNQVRFD